MKKQLLALILFSMPFFWVAKAESTQLLDIAFVDGTSLRIPLDESVKIDVAEVSDNQQDEPVINIIIGSYSFLMEELESYRISRDNNYDGSGMVIGEDSNPVITFDNDILTVKGCESVVSLYSVAGHMISHYSSEIPGSPIYIDLSELETGVYIAKINRLSFKFVKR